MQDMTQAYVAWCGHPDISFSRKGQIFRFGNEPDYYSMVFPEDTIVRLELANKPSDRDAFLAPRLLAWKSLVVVRKMLAEVIGQGGVDRAWNSVAYHLVWLYGQMFQEIAVDDPRFADSALLLAKTDVVVGATCRRLFESVHDQVMSTNAALPDADKYVIPRDLKSTRFLTKFLEGGFMRGLGYVDLKKGTRDALAG
jgi:hypothetical protein